MSTLLEVLRVCLVITSLQSEQPSDAAKPQGAKPRSQGESASTTRSDTPAEITAQMQRVLDYLEHRARGDQPARIGEIGEQAPRRSDRIYARIYDVADLFIPAPAYPARYASDWDDPSRVFPEVAGMLPGPATTHVAGNTPPSNRISALSQQGGLGGGFGGGMGGGSAKSEARPDLAGLMAAVTSTIAPNSWSEAGGANSITTLGSVLLVSAPEDVQRQVDQFLRLLRQLWGTSRTVRVHAYWLWLNDSELASLFPAGGVLSGTVNRGAWDALRVQMDDVDGSRAGYRAHLACFDGQTVFASAGGRRLSIGGLKPTVATQAVAYTPEMRVIHQGAVLQITPTATSDAKSVILDVHSHVTEFAENALEKALERIAEVKETSDIGRFAASLQGTQIEEHHLASTLLVPLNSIMLVGGMTGRSGHAADQLYLFVELSVQEPRLPAPVDAQPADASNPIPQ